MRKYNDKESTELLEIQCNCCGKQLLVKNGIVREGCMMYQDIFGYFSHKDGEMHSFDLCEDCYDRIVQSFKISVSIEEKELL